MRKKYKVTAPAKGAFYLAISEITFIVTGYFIHILLARKLGPTDYGVYSLVVSLVSVVNLFLATGIPKAVSKFISEDNSNFAAIKKSSLIIQATIGAITFGLLFILSKSISNFFKDENLASYIKIVSLMVPIFGLHSLFLGYLNGLKEYKKQAVSQLAYYLSKVILISLPLFFGLSLKESLYGFSISPIFGLITSLSVIGLAIEEEGESFIKKIILFSLPITIFSVINNLITSLDLFFIKSIIIDPSLVGYYSAAATIAKTILYITVPISSVVFPAISSFTYQKKFKKNRSYIKKSFVFSTLAVIGCALLFSFFSEQIISFVYSSVYLSAASPLKILAFGMAFFALYNLAMSILSGAGKLKSCIIISSLVVVLDAGLCLLLIKSYSLAGAAIATTISGFFGLCLSLISICRNMLRKNFEEIENEE